MAKLLNSITTNGPANIDERIKDKVVLLATHPISDRIAKITGISLWAVAEQLEKDGLLESITSVNCIFTDDGNVSIQMDPEQLGNIMRIIIYPMGRWLSFYSPHNPDYPIFLFIIEELAHHYWNIEDEVEVNYKVIEIMKHIFPQIQMEDVYSRNFMDNPTY